MRCACSFAHTKTRLEATLPFRTLEMQLQFSLHAGLFTSGGMLPSAKAHAYARPILLLRTTCTCTYARAAQCTHARAVRHRILAKTSLADAALHGCSFTAVDPIWPKLVFSATADCALHPYVSTTYRRPIPRTRMQGRVFARRRRKIWKLGSETVEF